MRRSWILAAAAMACLTLAGSAHAGTYDVVSCGAPGAGGVNRAWVGEIIPAGAPFTIAGCGSELLGATSSTRQQTGYFSGANTALGQPFPTRGVILALQGYEDGRWRTFLDTRTNRRGRWVASYRFSGRPGTYPVRVRIRRQSRFPFVIGASRAVRVRVR